MGLSKSVTKSYVDTLMSTINASPKGVYATPSTLQTAFPTGNSNIYLVSADGKWYYWNGSVWAAGGVYQATAITDASITPKLLSFSPIVGVKSKNLFNKDTVTTGYYISYTNGGIFSGSSFNASDYIAVNPNTAYIKRNVSQLAFYDISKTYISGLLSSASFTTPANCYYVRITVSDAKLATEQLEQGTVITVYESYTPKLNNDTIIDTSISIGKLNFHPVDGVPSGNLFDKTKVTAGYYLQVNSGVLTSNSSYFASDYIEVAVGNEYACSSFFAGAYYDITQTYISGLSITNIFTPPANTKYVRISASNTGINTFQIIEGTVLPDYENYKTKVDTDILTPAVVTLMETTARAYYDPIFYREYLTSLARDLNNPFIKTQIKLIGDSVTSGVGSTGYSETGDLIPGTSIHMNVFTTPSWANKLREVVNTKFNKTFIVDMTNKHITYSATPFGFYGNSSPLMGSLAYMNNNTNNKKGIEFEVYGTSCVIYYKTAATSGIADIYVDDVKVDTIDFYSSSTVAHNTKTLTFTVGRHTVLIAETYTKNTSSSNYTFYVESIGVTKTASVINYGQSGTQSLLANTVALHSTDDDYVFFMYGINDRSVNADETQTKTNLRNGINLVVTGTTKKAILLNYPPMSVTNDNLYSWGGWELNNAISNVTLEYDIPYINIYDYFLQYATSTGVSVDTFTVDGLHPNDAGHKLIYDYICRCIGLPVLRDGVIL